MYQMIFYDRLCCFRDRLFTRLSYLIRKVRVMNIHTPQNMIVFDLDGTLLDTWPSLLAAVMAFDPSGRALLKPFQLKRCLSDGIAPMLSLALSQLQRDSDPNSSDFQQLLHSYEQHWLCTAKAFEGAEQLLQSLQQAGYRIGLCTNRDPRSTGVLLEHFGWEGMFDAKVHLGDCVTAKPSPEPLLKTLQLLGGSVEKSLFVGDSPVDALCAARAKVAFAAHLAGYHTSRNELEPCRVAFSHYHELARWLPSHHPVLMEA